jgi:hypothetical protein
MTLADPSHDGPPTGPRGRAAVVAAGLVVVVGTALTLAYSRRHDGDYHGGDAYFVWTLLVSPVAGAVAAWRLGLPTLGGRRLVVRLLLGAAAAVGLSLVTAFFTAESTVCRPGGNEEECGVGGFAIAVFGVLLTALLLAAAGLVTLLGRRRVGGR